MIKALFTALTGIDESIDDEEYQASWERRRYEDENDIYDDDSDDCDDQDSYEEPRKGFLGLW